MSTTADKLPYTYVYYCRISDGVNAVLGLKELEDPVMRRLSDAQHDTLAEQCDFDVRKINGWQSLPIVESRVFARCAVCVRTVCGVCGRVRCCAVLCGAAWEVCPHKLERRAN
jgi:hypothetical protein